ncbi:glycerophosphodiester phosphodiesterase family protein [Dysgonomonas sp. BGC7]|uniref:glycerophosphodiester phosphodiesterase family protein n=1 Tax=Dysgonomonas sp. BGC7 TaxID=1658008 RepID=UPI00068031A6|nr:glycerophosphodiester phosphodiesterase family protein [Dysgonomonas sp. BGC7]MBD8388586.1 PKD domain-containing protein [Dysgonomonas sp. BGC7]
MKSILKIYCFLNIIILFSACSGDSEGEVKQEVFEAKIDMSSTHPAIGEILDTKVQVVAGTLASAEWNWGDGTVTQGIKSSHEYTAAGEYTLTLTAKDNYGKSVSLSQKVIVEGIGLTNLIKDFDRNKVWIIAHRANTGDKSIPENSMAAIEASILNTDVLNFVEVDPRTTKDGVMILMHDETVDRTTNGTGKVKDLTYEEIQKLKLKLDDGTVTSHSVPSLYDVFMKARGKVFINLDFINKVAPKEIYELVRNCGMLDRVMFTVGTKKDVAETMLGYSKTIHILGQYSNDGDEDYLSSAGGGDRISFVYITPAKALSTDYATLLWNKGFIVTSNILDQNGFTYDTQMLNGNYTGIDLLLAKKFQLLQTDYPKTLHAYLKTQGKR